MQQNYFENVKNWAHHLKEHWKETRSSIPAEQRIIIEEKLQQFERQLHEQTFENDEILYERAMNLYDSFRLFYHHSYVPIGQHRLPPLPYAYDALEPYISEKIMKLHHLKHHQSYVDGLNKAEIEMAKARKTGDYSLIKHWEREAAFHGAGHYLHTIFWSIMSPNGGGKPKGPLKAMIEKSFGSFDMMKKHFSEAAKAVEGGGWAILVWSPRSHRLEILQAEKHQNLSQWDVIPLLVLDVWEHAYYLQYENDRGKYIENWWKIVNWREVERRFHEAQKVKWQPF